MQQLLATGAISKLPEEVQWNVRVLLPRGQELTGPGQPQGAPGSVQNLSAGMPASLPLAAAAPSAPQAAPVVRKSCVEKSQMGLLASCSAGLAQCRSICKAWQAHLYSRFFLMHHR